jgi:hypothetical protein
MTTRKRRERDLKNWIFNEKRTAAKFTAIAVALLLLFPLSGGCAKPQSKEKVKGKNMSLLQKKPVYSLTVEVFEQPIILKLTALRSFAMSAKKARHPLFYL